MPGDLDSRGSGGRVPEYALITSSQMMWVQGPHLENHCSEYIGRVLDTLSLRSHDQRSLCSISILTIKHNKATFQFITPVGLLASG